MTEETSPPPILVLCRDLLFTSKITGAAKALDVPVKLIRTAAALDAETASWRLIVDLTQAGFTVAAAEWKKRTGGEVVGFAGHADTETLAEAERLQIDHVLAKGAFVRDLEQILTSWGNATG